VTPFRKIACQGDRYTERHWPETDGRQHFSRKIRILETIRVLNLFGRHQLAILTAERVAVARREIREQQPVGAADFAIF
jgi:hypothetical protein